ncbi:hypothetical protein BN946_scf185008.g94 [Trametes cinnabarina]|uniref:F-box domain-containing protein n=1 Tax=Pycnoporus cinnabarinus TaxID=5643 RepID=A0A060SGN9_PYCCI|nr:hypothetical protein BN946_scf185008.g94 [Trametes cinnabarina]
MFSSASRKALEDDIAVHEKAIIELKGRLNTMTDIARLPPELLSEIFLHLAELSYNDIGLSFRPSYVCARFYAWVSVTHVCRSWRTIALNTPRLWGHIVLTRSSIVNDVLTRSKKAPLRVTGYISSPHDERAKLLKNIMQESSRLKELHVAGPASMFRDLFPTSMEPANILETVVLSDYSHTSPFYNASDINQPIFRQEQLPRMRELEIRRLVFRWDSYALSPRITRLVINGRLDSQALLGTFDTLLSTLQKMHNLEYLELEDAIPRLPDTTKTLPSPARTLSFPRLQRLVLIGTSLDCGNLLNHISLHSGVHSKVVCRGINGSQELIRIFGAHVSRLEPLVTVQLSRGAYGGKLHVRGWRALVDPNDTNPTIELQVDALACSSLASYLVRDSKMFTRVRVLRVDAEDHDWRWKDVFAGMPDLEELAISGDPQDQFITAVSATRKTKRHNPPSLVLPSLRMLRLTHTRLCSPDYDQPPEFIDKLEDWLMMRCNYNMPIDELHLTCCVNITEDDVERLIEIVPYVKWDGIVEFESEEEDEEEEDYPYGYDDYDYDYYDDLYDDPWFF